MNDRVFELQLMRFEPYWQELLVAWLGCILLLAIIQATLAWLGKEKPGEFAKLLSLFPLMTVMALPALTSLLAAFRVDREYGVIASSAVLVGGGLLGVFVAFKLRRLLVWTFTGFDRTSRAKTGKPVPPETHSVITADETGPTINGQPLNEN